MSTEISFLVKLSPSSYIESESLMEISMMMEDLIVFSPPQPMLAPIDHSFEDELEMENFQLEERRPRAGSDSFTTKRKNKHIRKLIKRRGSVALK